MQKLFAVITVVLGLVLSPALASASDHGSHGRTSDHHGYAFKRISAPEYLTKSAASNQFEIVTGQLAQQKAQAPAVKELGAMFVAHHTELLQKGAAVAAELGLTVPVELTRQQQAVVAKLQRLSGKRFDRFWIAAQILAHEKALKLNLRAAIRGEVPQIRMLAQGALPIVTMHYGELLDLVEGTGHGQSTGDDDEHGQSDHKGDRDDDEHGESKDKGSKGKRDKR